MSISLISVANKPALKVSREISALESSQVRTLRRLDYILDYGVMGTYGKYLIARDISASLKLKLAVSAVTSYLSIMRALRDRKIINSMHNTNHVWNPVLKWNNEKLASRSSRASTKQVVEWLPLWQANIENHWKTLLQVLDAPEFKNAFVPNDSRLKEIKWLRSLGLKPVQSLSFLVGKAREANKDFSANEEALDLVLSEVNGSINRIFSEWVSSRNGTLIAMNVAKSLFMEFTREPDEEEATPVQSVLAEFTSKEVPTAKIYVGTVSSEGVLGYTYGGKTYSFARRGLDAAFYLPNTRRWIDASDPKFQKELMSIKKDMDRRLREFRITLDTEFSRAEKTLKAIDDRTKTGRSIRIGNLSVLRSDEEWAEVANKLRAGQIVRFYPSGMGTGWALSTRRTTYDNDKVFSDEYLTKLVGSTLFLTSFDHD